MIKLCNQYKKVETKAKITNLILSFDDVVGWFENRSLDFDNEESDLYA